MNNKLRSFSKSHWFRNIIFLMLLVTFAGTSSCSIPNLAFKAPAPTPQCVEPSLTLGTLKFQVASVKRSADSFPEIPNGKQDIAYWVEGTTVNYVFGIGPIKDNLALNSVLKVGDPIAITWADCSKDDFVVKSIESVPSGDLTLFDQSKGGVTVFVRSDSSNLVIRGQRPITESVETPIPTDANATQLDIQFSDLTPPDNQTVNIGLDITNKGAQAVMLTNNDISLTTENGPQVFPSTVEPALPQEIQPGGSMTLAVTFPKPQASSAVLKILDVTLDYYFQ
jgi:hypothetical protein